MSEYLIPPTTRQHEYIAALQKKLHLSDVALDTHCQQTYGAHYQALDRGQVSQLINQLLTWEQAPADLKRAQGQLDLIQDKTPWNQ